MNKTLQTLLLIGCLFFISCDRPTCTTDNQILITHDPSTKIYKDELIREMSKADQTKLRYWLQKYDATANEESLYFYVQGDGLCAVMHLTMQHWRKLERVRKKKGVGRRGAEFTNLTFNIVQDSLSTKFIYKTYSRLID